MVQSLEELFDSVLPVTVRSLLEKLQQGYRHRAGLNGAADGVQPHCVERRQEVPGISTRRLRNAKVRGSFPRPSTPNPAIPVRRRLSVAGQG